MLLRIFTFHFPPPVGGRLGLITGGKDVGTQLVAESLYRGVRSHGGVSHYLRSEAQQSKSWWESVDLAGTFNMFNLERPSWIISRNNFDSHFSTTCTLYAFKKRISEAYNEMLMVFFVWSSTFSALDFSNIALFSGALTHNFASANSWRCCWTWPEGNIINNNQKSSKWILDAGGFSNQSQFIW